MTRIIPAFVAIVLAIGIYSLWVGDKGKPKFTISKETTYVSGPVDAEGYIDYVAALNERLKERVTPENNANVLFWQAFGPQPERPTTVVMPAEYFELMETEVPPEDGDYFTKYRPYLRAKFKDESSDRIDARAAELDRARTAPWIAADLPELAAWLKSNEKPLAVVIAASNRPRYFNPLVPPRTDKGREPLLSSRLPVVQSCRDATFALIARAMLRIGEGKGDDAWDDLLAAHRISRLVAQGSSLIEYLVGAAIDKHACEADLVYLDHIKPTVKQILACKRDLDCLPAAVPVADRMEFGERFTFLELVMLTDRGGIGFLESLSNGEKDEWSNVFVDAILINTKWDAAMRKGNQWYDRYAKTLRITSASKRRQELRKIEEDIVKLKKETMDFQRRGAALLVDGKVKGETIGDILLCLMLPAVSKIQLSADRWEQQEILVHFAFALAVYHNEHGQYPDQLSKLAPKYLPEIPPDLFSDKALLYKPAENGYLLYSVGPNGIDDGGESDERGLPRDDIAVRMPVAKPNMAELPSGE